MSNNNCNTSYQSAFFVVPSHILNLEGLTLGFLKVYETIFQFWNHGKACFLSEAKLIERTGLQRSQIYEAINYFESRNEMKRVKKNGNRYFIRPEQLIETDFPGDPPTSAPPDDHVRSTGHTTSAPPDYNNKKLNKEINTTTSSSINFEQYKKDGIETISQINENFTKEQKIEHFKNESLEDEQCNRVFDKRFAGFGITIEELYQECVDYWSQTNQMVYKSRFKTHLEKYPLEKLKSVSSLNSSQPTKNETEEQRMKRYAKEKEELHRKIRGENSNCSASERKPAPVRISDLLHK